MFSNRKLHCCLAALILFIIIFLSLPLLLIYLANTNYEKCQRNLPPSLSSSSRESDGFNLQLASNGNNGTGSNGHEAGETCPPEQTSTVAVTNCTQYAYQADLTLSDENCTFPCSTCPDICIEQWRNCNGHADCPDRSDENSCHDGNGAIGIIFQSIVNIQNISNKSSSSSTTLSSAFAKPESCTLDQFVTEQCPCVYTDPRVIICENLGLTSVPSTLLSSVYKIRMSNNSISRIDHVLWPRSLVSLVLVNNRITRIDRSTFETAPNLSKLYLSHNEISYIDNEAFAGLSSLTSLQIEANKLTTFDSRMLKSTPMITKIYLSENMIDLHEETRFGDCQSLKEVLLDHNRISLIKAHWFSNMTSLIWLSLSHNEISVIEDGAFDWNYELEELNLSFNRIKFINRHTFAHRLNIQRLYLGGNPLQPLPVDAFKELVELRSLNLTHVHFDYIINGTFVYLTKLEFIYFAKFRYCHYANHVRVCRPSTDGLSSVEDLLAFPILKYAVWIVALVCCLGNVFVFIWRSVSPHEDCTLSLFVRNLSIADLMMGIYLGAIGWQDWKYQHKFGRFAIDWMSSGACTAIGFLAILSSELSVFILTIITIERYRSIISIETFEEETQKNRARFYVALAWILSFLIACYPLAEWLSKNSDYYATNGLCLPLHIDQPYSSGWQYSAFIYLGINFTAVLVIIVLYVHMYSMIMKVQKASKPALLKAEKREDAILAIRFFFIVVTDCLCWIPIVVIKVMALANVSISSSIYGWLVVFIIPINSALNPIVYTLAAPTSLRDAACRLFERICYKVDKLAAGSVPSSSNSSRSSSSGCKDSDSGQMTPGRMRKKTGSNSTTCDTIDTSISSQQSRQTDCFSECLQFPVDGRLQQWSGAVKLDSQSFKNGLQLSPLASDASIIDISSSSPIAAHQEHLGGGGRFSNDTKADGAYHNDNRHYEYLSTYSASKSTSQHKLINDQTGDSGKLVAIVVPAMSRRDSVTRRASYYPYADIIKGGTFRQILTNSTGKSTAYRRRRSTNPNFVDEELHKVANERRGQVEVQMLNCQSDQDLMLKSPAGVKRPPIVEDSCAFSSEKTSTPSILIDSKSSQITTSPRQSRVSFSSKDSRSCLLSQTDLR